MTMEEFLTATTKQKDFHDKLGIFALDWAMYNANYGFLIYNALLFTYLPTGELH